MKNKWNIQMEINIDENLKQCFHQYYKKRKEYRQKKQTSYLQYH